MAHTFGPRLRAASLLVATTALTCATATPAATASDPAPFFAVQNGGTECWKNHTTLRHFIVFNHGDKTGQYRVEFQRAGGELESYTRKVEKRVGINDGFLIPAGGSIVYVKISAPAQGVIYVRSTPITALARCS